MRLSVLITCYRRRKYLAEAVASVLSQTLPKERREIVVITDGVDATLAEEWRSQGVEVLERDLPGVGEMLVTGLHECHGEVVCFLDDDDAFEEGKLEAVAAEFEADSSLVLFRGGFDPVDESGRPDERFRRILSQPERSFTIETRQISGPERARIVRTRAYGNLSTQCVRRDALVARADGLAHVEAATDASVATLMLDVDGRHRFDSRRLTRRRVGTSQRSLGKSGEADRAIRTFAYLRSQAMSPAAQWYAEMMLSWARVDRFLNAEGDDLTFSEWLSYVRLHLPRMDAATWEAEAWSLAKMFWPKVAAAAYASRSSH